MNKLIICILVISFSAASHSKEDKYNWKLLTRCASAASVLNIDEDDKRAKVFMEAANYKLAAQRPDSTPHQIEVEIAYASGSMRGFLLANEKEETHIPFYKLLCEGESNVLVYARAYNKYIESALVEQGLRLP